MNAPIDNRVIFDFLKVVNELGEVDVREIARRLDVGIYRAYYAGQVLWFGGLVDRFATGASKRLTYKSKEIDLQTFKSRFNRRFWNEWEEFQKRS